MFNEMTGYESRYRISSPRYAMEETASEGGLSPAPHPAAQRARLHALRVLAGNNDYDDLENQSFTAVQNQSFDDSGLGAETGFDDCDYDSDNFMMESNMSFAFEDALSSDAHQDVSVAIDHEISSYGGAALYPEDSHAVILGDVEVSDFVTDHHDMSSINRPVAHHAGTQVVDVMNHAASNSAAVTNIGESDTRARPPQVALLPLEDLTTTSRQGGKLKGAARTKKPTLDDLVPYPNPLHHEPLGNSPTQERIDAFKLQRGPAYTERDPDCAPDKKRMRCSWCKFSFRDRNGCNRHILSHNMPDGVKCHMCGDAFKRSDKFANHIKSQHRSIPRMNFKTEYVQLFTGNGISERAMLFLRGETFSRHGSKKGPVGDRILTRNSKEYNRARTAIKSEKRRARKAAERAAQRLNPEAFPKRTVSGKKPRSQTRKPATIRPTTLRKAPRDFSTLIPATAIIENNTLSVSVATPASSSAGIESSFGGSGLGQTPLRRSIRTKSFSVALGNENSSSNEAECAEGKENTLNPRYAGKAPRKCVYETSNLLSHLAGKGQEIKDQGLAVINEVSMGTGVGSRNSQKYANILGPKVGAVNQIMSSPSSYLRASDLNHFP